MEVVGHIICALWNHSLSLSKKIMSLTLLFSLINAIQQGAYGLDSFNILSLMMEILHELIVE